MSVAPCSSSRIWLSELSGSLRHRRDDYWQITNMNFYIWHEEFTSLPSINSLTYLKIKVKNILAITKNGSHHRLESYQQTYFN